MYKTRISVTLIAFLFIFFTSCEEHEKELPSSEIYLNIPEDGYEVEVNDTIYVSPKITYDYNSSYSWKLDNDVISEERVLRLIPKSLLKYELNFNITNDRISIDTSIIVQSIYKTDFEEFEFEEDSFWVNNEESTFLISDQLKFEVNGRFSDEIWTGLTYSNLVGSNTEDEFEKYSCYNKTSDYESDMFGVLLLDANEQAISATTVDGENHLFKSISINNSKYIYEAIDKGEFGSKKFGGVSGTEKDSLVLVIKGFNTNGAPMGQVEVKLADFTTGSNRDNSILSEWTTYNLEAIGHVSKLEFTFVSSDKDPESGKINTPPFVCIDELKIVE